MAQLGPTLGSDLTSKKAKVEADSRNHTRIYHQRLTPFDTHEKNISFFVPVIGSCRIVVVKLGPRVGDRPTATILQGEISLLRFMLGFLRQTTSPKYTPPRRGK